MAWQENPSQDLKHTLREEVRTPWPCDQNFRMLLAAPMCQCVDLAAQTKAEARIRHTNETVRHSLSVVFLDNVGKYVDD